MSDEHRRLAGLAGEVANALRSDFLIDDYDLEEIPYWAEAIMEFIEDDIVELSETDRDCAGGVGDRSC